MAFNLNSWKWIRKVLKLYFIVLIPFFIQVGFAEF